MRTWRVGNGRVCGLSFSPDGRLLRIDERQPETFQDVPGFVWLDPVALHWWDLAGRPRQRFDWGIGPLFAVAFAPDGLTVAAGGADGQVIHWDLDA
jgi:hypothetical protein